MYCAIERGQRATWVKTGVSDTPMTVSSSARTPVTRSSSESDKTSASSPPTKQRRTALSGGTRPENFVPTQVQATRTWRSPRGARKPKPFSGWWKPALSYPSEIVMEFE